MISSWLFCRFVHDLPDYPQNLAGRTTKFRNWFW